MRERPDIVNQLPALLIAQLVFEGGHGQPPACNLPEEFAVRPTAHRRGVGKITRRDGKLGGFFALAVAFFSVAVAAVLAVGLLSAGDRFCSGGNGIFQPLGCRGGSPIR